MDTDKHFEILEEHIALLEARVTDLETEANKYHEFLEAETHQINLKLSSLIRNATILSSTNTLKAAVNVLEDMPEEEFQELLRNNSGLSIDDIIATRYVPQEEALTKEAASPFFGPDGKPLFLDLLEGGLIFFTERDGEIYPMRTIDTVLGIDTSKWIEKHLE